MVVTIHKPEHFKAAAAIIEKAEQVKMDLNERTFLGYNEMSGLVYIWNEDYPFTLCFDTSISKNFWATWCVEFLLTCPETGEEFFGTNEEEVLDLYNEFCKGQEIENAYLSWS